ncbi:ABC transporter ATP-binding protein [Lacrimispora saccharolytica]|uniref:ABC transporter related protein n=1 Tax=Lacrimispora saccharolytica (strain ATCC 35040 / DSM 2544 / NRCC 2533 / WM1) TaxID=610130 RepID=D9R411_LACSW|nr:ABC transporter ATP-binding protein [Lacrimispora saccharolytica]ADL03124.1 ABC transporter related protein [[Clostridium] saccharolyticum WM1]QRV18701.1 ABC transporter ATP-binding protein [Lacrimispora saccharolytica]
MEERKEALRVENIVKVYSNGVMANKGINFSVRAGEIHALSGENGAGKSTLMKIIFGEEQPTSGDIYVNGVKTIITSPQLAISLGIGMVHQHFMLVPSLTVTENVILGVEPKKGFLINRKNAHKQVAEMAEKFNMQINPRARIQELTVGQKQKVEILKALFRGAKILILDEPTAVLTPQETTELFEELKRLKNNGYTIIFISHKLNEVKELCDRISIIRQGRSMGLYGMKEVTEQDISNLMVGRDVILNIEKNPPKLGAPTIHVKDLCITGESGKTYVNKLSFLLREGEILGIAGVEGNGQSELAEALTGLRKYDSGCVELCGKEISGLNIGEIRKLSVSHIPEDRMTTGVAPALSITENALSDKISSKQFSKHGIIGKRRIKQYGLDMAREYQVLCKNPDVRIDSLSGGNIQKAVLARELSSDPKIIIANQPTRGVDVGATEFIRKRLIKMRDNKKSVLLISSDLNEVLGLSDSIMVMHEGQIVAYFPDAGKISEVELGKYMLGIEKQSDEEIKEVCHGQ